MSEEEEIDIELVEKYYRGMLHGSALEEFHKREKTDEAFASAVQSYKDIFQAIEYFGKQEEIANTIAEWDHEIKKKQSEGSDQTLTIGKSRTFYINRQRVYWAAAAVITLTIVSYIWVFKTSTPDTSKLYEAYYQPYPSVFNPNVRGSDDTVSMEKKAMAAYNQGDYATAAKYFETILKKDRDDQDITRLYLANCYLSTDSISAAKEILLNISAQSPVSDQATWYLALAQLKLQDVEGASALLEKLKRDSVSYKDKATALLQEIN